MRFCPECHARNEEKMLGNCLTDMELHQLTNARIAEARRRQPPGRQRLPLGRLLLFQLQPFGQLPFVQLLAERHTAQRR